MSGFKFGFVVDTEVDEADNNKAERNNEHWFESTKINPEGIKLNENINVDSVKCGDHLIKYLSSEEIVENLEDGDSNSILANAEKNHSDLITAVYEGGLKVWECTYDLLNYINANCLDLNGKKVLDLGCGAGLVGIFSCLKGAKTCFQDYNVDVIEKLTVPNVVLNNVQFDSCSFYCGDWKSFLDVLIGDNQEKFDYIFSSETIYNTDNYRKLLQIFSQLLKKNGTVYLAAKLHYFGVGGGLGQFEDMLKLEDKFNFSTCWQCHQGVKRSIIKITLK